MKTYLMKEVFNLNHSTSLKLCCATSVEHNVVEPQRRIKEAVVCFLDEPMPGCRKIHALPIIAMVKDRSAPDFPLVILVGKCMPSGA